MALESWYTSNMVGLSLGVGTTHLQSTLRNCLSSSSYPFPSKDLSTAVWRRESLGNCVIHSTKLPLKVSGALATWVGFSPVTNSRRTTPKLQTSPFGVATSVLGYSGAT
ncbi:hypothetical protein CFOL_v3_30398 [Cephalotus follicularis]|uniref:Uncharacterized protein n=1 Tax=Cephalotus follicularis TaxID=3775 RepID=A0A1Q3D3F6_CEPFO|nr:hypothetical protein CFOL_v3_30398 [Cephalotus follicularis]